MGKSDQFKNVTANLEDSTLKTFWYIAYTVSCPQDGIQNYLLSVATNDNGYKVYIIICISG